MLFSLESVLNESAEHCVGDVKGFVGDYDKVVVNFIIQEYEDFLIGRSVVFKFQVEELLLNNTYVWYDCENELLGDCYQKATESFDYKDPIAYIFLKFYKGDEILQEIKYDIPYNHMKYSAANAKIDNTQFCFSTEGKDGDLEISVVTIKLVSGEPRFEPDMHTNVVTLKGQVDFPNQLQQYCFNYDMDVELENMIDSFKKTVVTGVVEI